MSNYWLVPVLEDDPFTLGSQRKLLQPFAETERFREQCAQINPWFLPMFKASVLWSNEDLDICGANEESISLRDYKAIVFDGEEHSLSHCAEAFLNRLLSVKEMLILLDNSNINFTSIQKEWMDILTSWLHDGQQVLLLREDDSL